MGLFASSQKTIIEQNLGFNQSANVSGVVSPITELAVAFGGSASQQPNPLLSWVQSEMMGKMTGTQQPTSKTIYYIIGGIGILIVSIVLFFVLKKRKS